MGSSLIRIVRYKGGLRRNLLFPIEGSKEVKMPRKGSHPAYTSQREYRYTIKDIAELAGMMMLFIH
jgi:hypothetical protein